MSNPLSLPLRILTPKLFLWLSGWSPRSSLGTLVPEIPWCIFYATRRQVYWSLTHNVVFWYDIIHTKTDTQRHTTHSGTSRLTHSYKYIFTPPATCSQQVSLNWIDNSQISKSYFPLCLFFSTIIIHLKRSYICWLDAIRLDFSNITAVSKQKTLTHNKHSDWQRKITLERVS